MSEEITQRTSHELGKMLKAILSANRSDLPTDYCLAQKEAELIFDVNFFKFLMIRNVFFSFKEFIFKGS